MLRRKCCANGPAYFEEERNQEQGIRTDRRVQLTAFDCTGWTLSYTPLQGHCSPPLIAASTSCTQAHNLLACCIQKGSTSEQGVKLLGLLLTWSVGQPLTNRYGLA
jgi:hypothetical protein